jgi:hypothetical protein
MTMTLIDSTATAATNPISGTLEFKKETPNPAEGSGFGRYLSDMFEQPSISLPTQVAPPEVAIPVSIGQEIATPPITPGQEVALPTSGWPLQAVTLGPNLNVITPTRSAPDAQSLEAFARAQGLDEHAVHWLFGGDTGHLQRAMQGTVEVADAVAPSMTLANPLTLATSSASPAIASQANGASPTLVAIVPTGITPHTEPLHGLDGTLPPSSHQILTNGSSTGLLGSAMLGMQALWSMADDTGEHKKPTPLNQTSTEDLLPLHMLRMPPPAAVWMQRTAMNSAAPATLPPSPEDSISMSDLDLGADWGGDVLQQLLASDVGASTGANTTGTQGTAYANFAARWDAQAGNRAELALANAQSADLPDAVARSENIQNLADKMGQAVGQRILSEMERGQWHLKLSLRPATLGHIEVEMRLRSGEFDAVFTAPNAVTRELLQEGLSKLRETLNQMGMNVANMNVGDGQTGKNGENSTPGSFRGQPASNQAGPAETNPETTRVPSVKDPKDGLDVLV